MKIWKNLQRLAAATERFLKGIDFPKMLRNLENTCYRKYLLILVLVKLQTLCLDLWLKNEPHYSYSSSNFSTSKEPLLKYTSKKNVTILKCNVYYVTQDILYFIFNRCG